MSPSWNKVIIIILLLLGWKSAKNAHVLFVFGRTINKGNVNVKPVVQQDFYYKYIGVCVLAEFKDDFRLKSQKKNNK